ncbi:MAG TPA: TIGR03435 family protein [Terriglobales bacterium]|nr:TIGR03435 family protein [Terriglobales bacterium]
MRNAWIGGVVTLGLAWAGGLAQQPAPPRNFEVATLKPNVGGGGVMGGCHGVDSNPDPSFSIPLGRCVIVAGRLSHMMSIAFDLPMQRISGFPDWDRPSRWDVDAKIENPASATEAQLRVLLQNYLIGQFKLKLRHDHAVMPSYLLVVTKPSKLKPSAQSSMTMDVQPNGRLLLKGCSMADLAGFLSQMPSVGRPVVDHTQLAGRYDFTIDILNTPSQGDDNVKQNLAAWQSVFQDVQEQLGLKLEPGRSPVETIVIESAVKPQGGACSGC